MPHQILVTGGAGLTGLHLSDQLITKDHHVVEPDISDEQVHGKKRRPYLDPWVEFMVIRYCFANIEGAMIMPGYLPETGLGDDLAGLTGWLEGRIVPDRVVATRKEPEKRGLLFK